MTYKDDAKASRTEKLRHYADGGDVGPWPASYSNEASPLDEARSNVARTISGKTNRTSMDRYPLTNSKRDEIENSLKENEKTK